MKAATSTERVKASKLRARRAANEKLSAPQRAFLERYDRDHPPRQPPRPTSTVRDVARPSSPRASVDRSGDGALEFGKPRPAIPTAPIDPNAPPADPAAAPTTGTDIVKHDPNATLCPVGPDCVGCRSAVPAPECITTGRRQYPMMDDDAAQGQAGMLLGAMSFAGKLFRKDHAVIKFDEDEVEHFAKVWKRFVHIRASYLAQANDVTALMFVGGLAVARVATADTPTKATPAAPVQPAAPHLRSV